MKSIHRALTALISATLLACVACGGGYTVARTGPPPHAPAYGYRYHHPHDHVVLIYSPDLAVYRVSGYPNYYYSDGRYYRLRGGTWYYTSHIKGPWVATTYQAIPSGLHKKYKATPPGHSKHATKYKRGHGKHGGRDR